MAITTDTGAKKIENSENWRNIFSIHNDTVDAYDALAEQKDEEIGIVVKGNKTAHTGGAAAGQYIILRNSTITGCDDGLYTAAQAIPYDTVIDSTYLTAVSGGGLNALNASSWNCIYSNTTQGQSEDARGGARTESLLDNILSYKTVLYAYSHPDNKGIFMTWGSFPVNNVTINGNNNVHSGSNQSIYVNFGFSLDGANLLIRGGTGVLRYLYGMK